MNKENNPLFKYDTKKWTIIGSILGYDYLKNTHSYGFETLFNKPFNFLVTWDLNEIEKALHEIQDFL